MMFLCVRKNKKGQVSERFLRCGESAQDVLKGLECFKWPTSGEWEITDPSDIDEEDYLQR